MEQLKQLEEYYDFLEMKPEYSRQREVIKRNIEELKKTLKTTK